MYCPHEFGFIERNSLLIKNLFDKKGFENNKNHYGSICLANILTDIADLESSYLGIRELCTSSFLMMV